MKVVVNCPICGEKCTPVLEKTMSINKDILFECSSCRVTKRKKDNGGYKNISEKLRIPVRIFKTKQNKMW